MDYHFPEWWNRTPTEESEATESAIKRYRGGEQYGVTTDIVGNLSYGYGDMDHHGFWEFQLPTSMIKSGEENRTSPLKEFCVFVPTDRQNFVKVIIHAENEWQAVNACENISKRIIQIGEGRIL